MSTETLTTVWQAPLQDRSPGLVLVVDDEAQNRMLLRDPLEARGYEVIEAENGMEALQRVAERSPDVILLDVMMPRLDGFEVCRRLKHYRKAAPIPVLMITALSEREERLKGIQAGANDFLHKPIDIEDVILRVGNAVYAKRLYDQLKVEQQRAELLLFSLLPKSIAERMKNGETNIAENFSDATVLFADLVGFTALSAHVSPDQVVCLLNEIFSTFDVLVEKHGLEKIKTLGDGYMVAGGIPIPRNLHAQMAADLALDMEAAIEKFNHQYDTSIRIRIGINSGQVVAGVIGQRRLAYDLWGDAVNVASRLATLGEAGKIHLTESTYNRLKNDYWFDAPKTIEIKGRESVATYVLRGRKARMEEMGLLSPGANS